MVHETYSKKVAPALIFMAGMIEKEILAEVAKLVECMPGIAHGPLVIMRESLSEMKPDSEIERLRILMTLFKNLCPAMQEVRHLHMDFPSS